MRTGTVESQCYSYLEKGRKNDAALCHAFDILSLACVTKKELFVDFMCIHILKHILHFVKDGTFMAISFEVLNTLTSKSRKLATVDEGTYLLIMIISWVNHSRAERRHHRKDLIRNINSSGISTDYAVSLIDEHESFLDRAIECDGNIERLVHSSDPIAMLAIHFVAGTFSEVLVVDEFTCLREYESLGQEIRDLQWFIKVVRTPGSEYLSFFAYFRGGRSTCIAEVGYILLSQEEGKEDFVKNSTGTCARNASFGYAEFIKWDDIVDPINGYIKDDTVLFQIRVSF